MSSRMSSRDVSFNPHTQKGRGKFVNFAALKCKRDCKVGLTLKSASDDIRSSNSFVADEALCSGAADERSMRF